MEFAGVAKAAKRLQRRVTRSEAGVAAKFGVDAEETRRTMPRRAEVPSLNGTVTFFTSR